MLTEENVGAFWAHVAQLEAEHDVELTDEGRQALAEYVVAHGFNPDVTRDAFDQVAREAFEIDGEEYDEPWAAEDVAADVDPREQFTEDVTNDLARFHDRLGRKLTATEVAGLQQRMEENVRKYGAEGADVQRAFDDYYAGQGKSAPDLSNREDRIAHMTERFRDAERETEAQSPPADRTLDMDKHQDRVEYMMHRLDGGDVEYVDED